MGLLKKRDANYILKKIAKAHGMSAKELKQEIEQDILATKMSSDPEIQAEYRRLFGTRTPTAEEFLLKRYH